MHAANRSQVVGGASALAVGALAVGALVAPFATQSVAIPVVKAPVALSASPIDTITGLLTAGVLTGQAAAGGVIGSATQANVVYPVDTLFIGGSLLTQVQSLINNPSTIPANIVALPGEVEGLVELVESQSTGVVAGGQVQLPAALGGGVAYTLPGQFVPSSKLPVTANPATWPSTDTVNKSATAGFLTAATIVDTTAGAAGLPKVATPIVRGAGEVGTSLIQAQGLVRSASASAVQNTFTAVATGNPTAVRNAVVNGVDGVSKSVFGDSTVPLVKSNPTGFTPGLGSVTGTAGDTVEPVKRLGAIRTVTQTVTKAVTGVASAATGGA